LKEQLDAEIAQHEQMAEKIEMASDPTANAKSPHEEADAIQAKPPDDHPGGSPDPTSGQPDAPV